MALVHIQTRPSRPSNLVSDAPVAAGAFPLRGRIGDHGHCRAGSPGQQQGPWGLLTLRLMVVAMGYCCMNQRRRLHLESLSVASPLLVPQTRRELF